MKKIYILTAVLALLTLSLNAQNANTNKTTASTKGQATTGKVAKSKRISLNDMLCGIKGMSSILPESNPVNTSSARPMRAPLKINSDETTVGPFTGDNFDDDGGLGFGGLYPNNQDIRVATILERSEFAQHNGDQLVGFRFALAGQTSTNNQVKVYDFFSWPVGTNGYFETANRLTWNLGDWSTASTDYQLINNDLTSTNFSTGSITTSAPWTATNVNNQSNGSFYILSSGNLKFTVPSGYSNADFKFSLSTRGSYYAGTFVFTPSTGSAQTLTTSAANTVYECELTGLSTGDVVTITGTYGSYGYSPDFTYMHVYAKGGTANYMTLTGGQWYEYYLDEPIDFVVNDSIDELFLGYSYEQYPSSSTSELRFPMGVNPESTTHDHAAWLYYPNSSTSDITITVPGNTVNFSSIRVYDTSNNLLTSWYSTSTNTGTTSNSSGSTSTYYIMPDGWTVENAYMFQYGSSGSYTGYVSSSDEVNITISQDALNNNTTVNVVIAAYDDNGNVTMSVNGVGKTISKSTSGTYTWSNVELATTTYDYGLYSFDFSQYGDLAVQLIFKSNLPKTDSPTLSDLVDNGDGTYTITATATDPTATVTLTIGNQTVEGTGSASITITQTETAQNVTATATAQETDKRVSDPATRDYTIPAIPKTDTPTLSELVDNGDGTYTITATGNGTVTLTVSGHDPVEGTGSASVTITQTETAQNVTATATAQETGKLVSDPATRDYTIPAIPTTDSPTLLDMVDNGDGTVTITATGNGTVSLTVLGQTVEGQGTASITIVRSIEDQTVTATATAVEPNHQVSDPANRNYTIPALEGDPAQAQEGLLRMHLLVVDQFKENIPDDNSHPEHYGYVLKYEPNGPNGTGVKESGTVQVDIKKTEANVNGYYTLSDIQSDIDRHLTLDVLTADVGMFLPGEDPDVLYYQMQSKKDANPELGHDYITQLQYMKNIQKYEEMLATSPNKTHRYNANETYHYFDDSTPIVTGTYGQNFMTYAPSVSTWGIQRRYFETDGLDNTYGAPIWKTGVGQVRVIHTEAQLQRGPQGSTQWDGVGGPCSLVFLGVEAFGDLPSAEVSNILYEPYMFRVWVQSPGNNLRGCNLVAKGVDPDKPGEHWTGDGTSYGADPVLVYEGLTTDGILYKHVQPEEEGNNVDWGEKIQFGALDSGISDLVVYVRFYYRSTGRGINNSNRLMLRGEGDEDDDTPEVPGYYATEGDADPQITTGIMGVYTDLSKPVESVTYVNAQGMQSSKPFDGVNIVITRYTDGTTSTRKVVR